MNESFLREHVKEYEAAVRQAEKYILENRRDLEKRYAYAKYLKRPVKENQVMVLWNKTGAGGRIPGRMLEHIRRTYGNEYACVCYAKDSGKKGGDKDIPEGVTLVDKDSPEYWEALACSRYLISNMAMQAPFTKRREQVYFNVLAQGYEREDLADQDFVSRFSREMLKTDYIWAPSMEDASRAWKEKTGLGNIYDGTVLVCRDPEKSIADMTGFILGKRMEDTSAVKKMVLREKSRKKLLVLTNRKDTREHRYLVRNILERLDTEAMDVAVLAPWISEPEEFSDFMGLPVRAAKVLYRGRLVLEEEDVRNYRILEKWPDICGNVREIREYMHGLMGREWQRIWGCQDFDSCLMLGCQGYLQHYLAMEGDFRKRILIDLDHLETLRDREPARWRTALSAVDEIWAPAAGRSLGIYGPENREKVRRLPVLLPKNSGERMKTVDLEGESFLLCEQWREEEQTGMKLLRLPEPGSLLVNAEPALDEAGRKRLLQLADEKVYLLGVSAKSYRAVLPDAVILEEYILRTLYLLPGAGEYFSRFRAYCGNREPEYDALGEICRQFGVPELK